MTSADIGCSLAEAAESAEYTSYLQEAAQTPNSLHVVYINTSLRTKATAHSLVPTITCTSSNVVQTVLQAFAQVCGWFTSSVTNVLRPLVRWDAHGNSSNNQKHTTLLWCLSCATPDLCHLDRIGRCLPALCLPAKWRLQPAASTMLMLCRLSFNVAWYWWHYLIACRPEHHQFPVALASTHSNITCLHLSIVCACADVLVGFHCVCAGTHHAQGCLAAQPGSAHTLECVATLCVKGLLARPAFECRPACSTSRHRPHALMRCCWPADALPLHLLSAGA